MKKNKSSFTHFVKTEVANTDLGSNNESIAELHAFLSVNGNLIIKDGHKYLSTTTDNETTAKRIYAIFIDLFGKNFPIDVLVNNDKTKNDRYQILIYEDFGVMKQLGLNVTGNKKFLKKVLKDSDAFHAFFRGLFLASGSINNPETTFYHLEIVLQSLRHAKFIQQTINNFDKDFNFKITQRRNRFIVYAKKSEIISDFMKLIGAKGTLLAFENERIERDFTNSVNRVHNMDLANLHKTSKASIEIIKIIKRLEKINNLSFLSDKGKEIAKIRVNNPEMNLSTIAKHYTKTSIDVITKSGVNHIMRRIKEYHKKYTGEQ